MRDIEYGLFAQAAYYNWYNYRERERNLYEIFENSILMQYLLQGKLESFQEQNKEVVVELSNGQKVKIYKEEDKRLLMMYSEDNVDPDKNQKYKDLFDGWELIEGTNHEKIYNESQTGVTKRLITGTREAKALGERGPQPVYENKKVKFSSAGINIADSGFQGVAFKKDNKVLISLRGTDFGPGLLDEESEFNKDMIDTNIEIFTDVISDQVLCAIYFYEKIKREYPSCEIHVTGHSLGGGLAQFVALYGGEDIKRTVTWNGLGVRNIYEELGTGNSIGRRLLKELVSFVKGVYEDFTSSSMISCLEALVKIKDKESIAIRDFVKVIYTSHKEMRYIDDVTEHVNENLKIIDENYLNDGNNQGQNPFKSLMKLKIIGLIDENYEKLSENLKNYYLSGDIVRTLSSKTGTNICVDNPEDSSESGGILKTIKTFVKGGNISWHSINNFLAFFGDDGEIIEDRLNIPYFLNYIKSLLVDSLDLGSKLKTGEARVSTGIDYPKSYLVNIEEARAKILGELLLNKNRYKINFIIKDKEGSFLLANEVDKEVKLGNTMYRVDGEEMIFGKFSNYDTLMGVMGGEEIRLDLIEILKNQHPDGRKIDYISEVLLRNEFRENGLNFMVKDGGYNFFSSVVETMHTKDLRIFDLAEKVLNQPDETRVYLEATIEAAIPTGETNEKYKGKESWEPSDIDLVEKLYEQASKREGRVSSNGKEVSTPKSKAFYKSFLDQLEEKESKEEIKKEEAEKREKSNQEGEKETDNGKISLVAIGKYPGAWEKSVKDRYTTS